MNFFLSGASLIAICYPWQSKKLTQSGQNILKQNLGMGMHGIESDDSLNAICFKHIPSIVIVLGIMSVTKMNEGATK